MSIFKQKLIDQAKDDIKDRRKLHNDRVNKDNHLASITNPAFCIISGGGVQIPDDKQIEFKEVYSKFKHSPILNSVTVEISGNGFLVEANIEISCFTREDFLQVEEAFCAPCKEINILFGYAVPFLRDGYTSAGNIEGMRIVGWEFNYEAADNIYSVKLKAMSPGQGLKQLSMNSNIAAKAALMQPKYEFKMIKLDGFPEKVPVTGIPELITFYAQGNGNKLLSNIEENTLIDVPDKGLGKGVIIVYDMSELNNSTSNWWNTFKGWFSKGGQTPMCSLDFIINLINDSIKGHHSDNPSLGNEQKNLLENLKIEFHKDYSQMWVPSGTRSSRPMEILLIGQNDKTGTFAGDYLKPGAARQFLGINVGYKADQGIKYEDVKDLDPDKHHTFIPGLAGVEYSKIELKNIYINQSIIEEALEANEIIIPTDNDESENDEHKEELVTIEGFLNYIFRKISNATGGHIKLRLMQDPNCLDDPIAMNKLYISAENDTYTPNSFDVIQFDPIAGDGILRSHSIQSGAGDANYKASMFATSDSGKVADLSSEQEQILARFKSKKAQDKFKKKKNDIDRFCTRDGKLHRSRFADEQLKTLNKLIGELKDDMPYAKRAEYSKLTWPGLELNVELEGIWGIIPGCGMYSTILPKEKYLDEGRYFGVETVTHSFTNESQWTTSLKGRLFRCDPSQINEV